jgi:multiple sugar transport system permease protein
MNKKNNQNITAWVLIFPFIFFFTAFLVYPTFYTVVHSFTDSPLIGWGNWIGFKNYTTLLKDKLFAKSIINTFIFVAWTVIPNTILGLLLAMMVNRIKKAFFSAIVLVCFFIPHILPVTVVTDIFTSLTEKNTGGIQWVLHFFGSESVSFFKHRHWAMPAVAIITVWWTVGFNILLFLAGLKMINSEIYEASEIDGANHWHQFRFITWPLIWPITALVITLQLIFQLKIFDQVYLLTLGGPYNKTMVVLYHVYKQSFMMYKGGYASAIALVIFVFIVLVSLINYFILRSVNLDKQR